MQKLSKLLDLDPLNKCKLLTDSKMGLEKEITGITIIEAPDIAQWIKPGTILLTNFYGIGDNLSAQLKLVKELSEASTGALFIKLHRFVESVDPELIAYANELELPLLELPMEIAYTEMTSVVMAELFNEQVNRLNYFKWCHERFTEVSLNLNLSDAVGVLSELLGKQVALYNELGEIRTRSFTDEINKDVDIYNKNICQSKIYKGRLDIYGMVYPNDLERIAIDMAITSIILIINREEAIREAGFRSKDSFMNDLLYGRTGLAEGIKNRADGYGIKLDRPALVAIIEGTNQGNSKENTYLLRDCNRIIKELGLNEIHMEKNKRSIYFIQEKENEGKLFEKTKEFADSFLLENEKVGRKIIIGIGSIVANLSLIKVSFKEALDCLDLKNRMFVEKNIIIYDELGIYKLLGRYDKRAELIDYIPETLRRLHRHDVEENDNLTYTLAIYLEANMNAMKASEKMFIHYKTVVYRLNKIKNIAGVDFDNREQILEIEIGLKIIQILDLNSKDPLDVNFKID